MNSLPHSKKCFPFASEQVFCLLDWDSSCLCYQLAEALLIVLFPPSYRHLVILHFPDKRSKMAYGNNLPISPDLVYEAAGSEPGLVDDWETSTATGNCHLALTKICFGWGSCEHGVTLSVCDHLSLLGLCFGHVPSWLIVVCLPLPLLTIHPLVLLISHFFHWWGNGGLAPLQNQPHLVGCLTCSLLVQVMI